MALVCLCHAVSERKVHRAIAHGAITAEQVGEACGAGTCCQGCVEVIDEMISEHLTVRGRVRTSFA